MPEKNPPKDTADLFRRITRLSSEADYNDAELQQLLLEHGIDPDLLFKRVYADVRQFIRNCPNHWQNRAASLRSKVSAKLAATRRRQTQKLNRKELLGNIEAVLARMPPSLAEQFSLEYRNFEECCDEDLESILSELECIEGLDDTDSPE